MLPREFIAKWSRSRLKESAASQSHFNDLCVLIGQPTPTDADPDGDSYTFEKGAARLGGGDGWADVWKRGYFAWEYKGKHKNLEAAYRQLLEYREALENPPLLVVSDMDRFEVHTNFTNTPKKVYRFTIAEVDQPEPQRVLKAVFENPEVLRPGLQASPITEVMAARFARLADMLRGRGVNPERAAHFLTRIIFCLFAEDVGLLPARHFSRIVESTVERPERFTHYIQELFTAMVSGGTSLLEEIPHFNGGLFADADVVPLRTDELRIIREAGDFDWDAIEPAIFGTLFERGLDPDKRSQIGAHYTHPDDILDVLEPVMAPLRREWEQVRDQALALSDTTEAPPARASRRRDSPRVQVERLILGFLDRLSRVTVLDPACGSGNFLYLSMNLLKDLEWEVLTFAGNLGLTVPLSVVTPSQLHGIEVNLYARELAQAAIWIGFIQWYRRHGILINRDPILDSLETIRHSDAILDLSDPSQPREPEWPDAEFIVGNPPFLGGKLLRRRMDNAYVDALFQVYRGRVNRESDLVCYWFEKARAMLAVGRAKRAGLLATQGIRGGANRSVLERIKETGDIFLGYSDRPWILDGAAVHVSIVGFDDGAEGQRMLDGAPATAINANLTAGIDLTQARRLKENLGIAFMGDTKGGPFDIPADLAARMLASPNPHGRPNRDVVRPWINGLDITRRPREMWIIDFGSGMSEAEAALYEAPFEYVLEHVRPDRQTNRREAYAIRWWIHAEPRPAMRLALAGLPRFIGTARVAKHRLFVWLSDYTLPDSQVIVVARDDDYAFGVLHSRVHEVWARAKGTQLREAESGFRYTPTTTFEAFPFPRPTDEQREAIATVARELNTLRENWLNPPGASERELRDRTLTNLYNRRPTWLANIHARLDAAVVDAYRWPHDITDDDLLARLLALNLEREPA